MQYVRSLSGSVSKTWNSINPATLSGAIDVIVVEQEDGSLACSPFHVRFGKFSLLRPYEKKVEFRVNGEKTNYAMKLGEGGEAFFVFETSNDIPESLQTSPVISPAASPQSLVSNVSTSPSSLQEPEFLDLDGPNATEKWPNAAVQIPLVESGVKHDDSEIVAPTTEIDAASKLRDPPVDIRFASSDRHLSQSLPREQKVQHIRKSASEEALTVSAVDGGVEQFISQSPELPAFQTSPNLKGQITPVPTDRSMSPPPISISDAVTRAKHLSQKLSGSNIPTQVTDSGDLMLDMTGFKSSEEDALRAEVVARKILAEELEGNYDIGALIGADEHGNLWIYSSEEAKEAASRRISLRSPLVSHTLINDTASDPGYQSDEEKLPSSTSPQLTHHRAKSENVPTSHASAHGASSETTSFGDPSKNYAKTLRLTSDQLKALELKPGVNAMSFSVNRATCQAFMYYWNYDVPIVISDIDGTITKSDALGHVLNMIGRDWTHIGVAKLYTDIVANGYNIVYLTSRSVGQADTTRTYLSGVSQDGYKLPRGPVIMSPDRTIAALRREIYLRKPEVFKMACLRDLLTLFGRKRNPFYAGFGNRLTDALSYRSVNIPSTRIFTINSNAEVSLDLLTLNSYRSSYVTMREAIDQFFPPVGLLVTGEGEDFTDFNYWREDPVEIIDVSDSEADSSSIRSRDQRSLRSEDEGSEGENDDDEEEMVQSFLSQDSAAEASDLVDSILESRTDGEVLLRPSLENNATDEDDRSNGRSHGR